MGVIHREETRNALNEINLFPTKSQVNELVHCACERDGRMPVDHLTFGEFSILVTELREQYHRGAPRHLPLSVNREKARWQQQQRRLRGCRARGDGSHFQVFLGGSCNPTQWRKDVAIPYLKDHGITYYNPQVLNWRPELMEMEDQAKQSAELLFFVIDNETRSTASMVEAAYLAGCGRQLILIIKNFEEEVWVAGERLSPTEVEDLERSHAFLIDLVERMRIPVFDNIETALDCTAKVVKQGLTVQDLGLKDKVRPIKCPHVRVADKFMKIKEAFHNMDAENSGKLSYQDMCLAYKSITSDEIPESASKKSKQYTFEEFCLIVSEFKYRRKSLWRRLLCSLIHFPLHTYEYMFGSGNSICEEDADHTRRRDIFLGGTCGSSRWRQQKVIPQLKKHGLSYYDPQVEQWSTGYIPLEAAVKDNCRLLFYVITNDTRGVTSMLEVGHHIGQGCDIVLCLQHLPQNATLDDEELTDYAVKDYNRARTYLSDLATRDNVSVFEDIPEATEFAISRLSRNQCDNHS